MVWPMPPQVRDQDCVADCRCKGDMMPLLHVPSNQKITRCPRRNCRKLGALTSLSRVEAGAVCRNHWFENRFVKRRVFLVTRTNRAGGMRLAGRRGEEMW